MAGFNLSGAMAGAGQGFADVGKTMVTTGAALNIEAERAKVQALRDERQMAFTTTERVAGEGFKAGESAKDRSLKERQHTETLAAADRSTAASNLKSADSSYKATLALFNSDSGNAVYSAELKSAKENLDSARETMKAYMPKASAAADAKKGAGGTKDYSSLSGMPGKKLGATDATAPAPKTEPGLIQSDMSQADAARLAEIEKMLAAPGTQLNIPLRRERQALRKKLGMPYESED